MKKISEHYNNREKLVFCDSILTLFEISNAELLNEDKQKIN